MPKIYLHIGYPKTGTTSIQKYYFLYKSHFQEKGYSYIHTPSLNKSLEVAIIADKNNSQTLIRMNSMKLEPREQKKILTKFKNQNVLLGKHFFGVKRSPFQILKLSDAFVSDSSKTNSNPNYIMTINDILSYYNR